MSLNDRPKAYYDIGEAIFDVRSASQQRKQASVQGLAPMPGIFPGPALAAIYALLAMAAVLLQS